MMPAPERQRPLLEEIVQRLDGAWAPLPDKAEETVELTARALWFAASGEPRSVARAGSGALPALDDAAMARLRAMVERRCEGTPLAHITGRQSFLGLEMLATPEALIPRRETELLALTAIAALRATIGAREAALAIDVCTGSGNVALAIAAREPRVTVIGADLSAEAVALARRNAAHLGLSARTRFHRSDLFDGIDRPELRGSADLVTCNPPYISSAKVPAMAAEISEHEPPLAFDGGSFGLGVITRLVSDAPRFLRPGASLCFEVGAGTGEFIFDRVRRNAAYADVRAVNDEASAVRVLVATLAATLAA
jgi:release factor glutamine methyltransferase